MCSFCRNFGKLCGMPGFWKNVFDSFCSFALKLPIQTLLSVWPSRSVFWLATQFQQNEHTPGVIMKTIESMFKKIPQLKQIIYLNLSLTLVGQHMPSSIDKVNHNPSNIVAVTQLTLVPRAFFSNKYHHSFRLFQK